MNKIIIILVLMALAGCTTTATQEQPMPTYVIKVWMTEDANREVAIQVQNRNGDNKSLLPTITPATSHITADRALDYHVESVNGDMLSGELRFQFKDKDEWLADAKGPRMSFQAPARSE